MRKHIILLMLCLLAILISVSAVSASNWYVNDTGGLDTNPGTADQPFKSISIGVGNATDGDTVNIAAGTYTGNLNKNITITNNITIQGSGQDQTIIDLNNSGRAFTIIYGKNTTIKDLTINNGHTTNFGGAIRGEGCILTVTDCNFNNNTVEGIYEGGAIANNGYLLTVANCNFTSNSGGKGGAIAVYRNSNITNCIFNNNNASSGGAIYNLAGNATITSCNFYNNTATGIGGAYFGENQNIEAKLTVKYSRFVGNNAGSLGKDIYANYGGLENATLNWWGSNSGPTSDRIYINNMSGDISALYTPWLIMKIKAEPTTVQQGQTSKITVDVYTDSNGVDHSSDAAQFFSGPEVTFTTNLGNVGSKQITVPWAAGSAYATLRADEGAGVATVTAADEQTLLTTSITILPAANAANTITTTGRTIGMQETGIPIAGLILAILAVFSGLITPKRK